MRPTDFDIDNNVVLEKEYRLSELHFLDINYMESSQMSPLFRRRNIDNF